MKRTPKNGHYVPVLNALDDMMGMDNRITWGLGKQLTAVRAAWAGAQNTLEVHVRRILVHHGAPDGPRVSFGQVPAENRAAAEAELDALANEDGIEVEFEPIPEALIPDTLVCLSQSRLTLWELGVIVPAGNGKANGNGTAPAARSGKARGRRPRG